MKNFNARHHNFQECSNSSHTVDQNNANLHGELATTTGPYENIIVNRHESSIVTDFDEQNIIVFVIKFCKHL